jgi:hypothetical protein
MKIRLALLLLICFVVFVVGYELTLSLGTTGTFIRIGFFLCLILIGIRRWWFLRSSLPRQRQGILTSMILFTTIIFTQFMDWDRKQNPFDYASPRPILVPSFIAMGVLYFIFLMKTSKSLESTTQNQVQ